MNGLKKTLACTLAIATTMSATVGNAQFAKHNNPYVDALIQEELRARSGDTSGYRVGIPVPADTVTIGGNTSNTSSSTEAEQPSGPITLELRPAFVQFKADCIANAYKLDKAFDLDPDATAQQICGCAAAHSQVTGMTDSMMEDITVQLASGNWDVSAIKRFEDYEYVLEYCLQDDDY